MVEEGLNCENSTFPSYHEENEPGAFNGRDSEERLKGVDEYLFLSLGLTLKQNAWGGPDHWKYRKTKVSEIDPSGEQPVAVKRQRKKVQPDLDFTKALEEEMPDIFAPPKNPKSLLLPANRAPCNTKLPEDSHYQPEDLIKLFLIPNFLGRRGKKSSDESRQESDDYGQSPFYDDDNVFGGQYDDGISHSDVEDFSTLVSQPRQVNKIEVHYDKTSKQVDVQVLKETLWVHVQESVHMSTQGQEQLASFKQILAGFPSDCRAAGTVKEISPHLCFICLLHLANEHGFRILGNTKLDDLSIDLP